LPQPGDFGHGLRPALLALAILVSAFSQGTPSGTQPQHRGNPHPRRSAPDPCGSALSARLGAAGGKVAPQQPRRAKPPVRGPVYAPALTIDLPSRSAAAGLERVACRLPGIMEWQNVPGGNPACCAEGELR